MGAQCLAERPVLETPTALLVVQEAMLSLQSTLDSSIESIATRRPSGETTKPKGVSETEIDTPSTRLADESTLLPFLAHKRRY